MKLRKSWNGCRRLEVFNIELQIDLDINLKSICWSLVLASTSSGNHHAPSYNEAKWCLSFARSCFCVCLNVFSVRLNVIHALVLKRVKINYLCHQFLQYSLQWNRRACLLSQKRDKHLVQWSTTGFVIKQVRKTICQPQV